MRAYYLLPLGLLFVLVAESCLNRQSVSPFYGKVVSVDMDRIADIEMSDLFDKIELTCLENSDSTLLDSCKDLKVFVSVRDSSLYYLYCDNKGIISVFDDTGHFVSSSRKRYGKDHGEYQILMDYAYNRITNCIDLLTPTAIISYDLDFNHVVSTLVTQHKDCFYGKIAAVSAQSYLLEHTSVSPRRNIVFLYDRDKDKVTKEISYEADVISALTQNVSPIRQVGGCLFFSPQATSYHSYTIDTINWTLKPIWQMDFGSRNIDSRSLKNMDEREQLDYLAFEADYPLPLRNFMDYSSLISQIRYKQQYYTCFINLFSEKEAIMSSVVLVANKMKDNKKLPLFSHFDGKVLYALAPYSSAVEMTNQSMLNEDLPCGNPRVEERNPVVIKYYVRGRMKKIEYSLPSEVYGH